jgi:hypothetical protein
MKTLKEYQFMKDCIKVLNEKVNLEMKKRNLGSRRCQQA